MDTAAESFSFGAPLKEPAPSGRPVGNGVELPLVAPSSSSYTDPPGEYKPAYVGVGGLEGGAKQWPRGPASPTGGYFRQ